MKPKSPFLIFQNFLSPLLCETVINAMDVTTPDTDRQGHPLPSVRHNAKSERIVFERIEPNIPHFEEHYNIEYRGTEIPTFEWYVEGVDDKYKCGSSEYLRSKWVRVRDRDLTGVIFLTDQQEQIPFDQDFEVSGGKLEFPQHGFGFNPERGTMIVFPAGPHFIHHTAPIKAGNLFQVRFHIATLMPFFYQPDDFPGTYEQWLTQYIS